jgi:putative nucleotidyltransferase with HDIG domain
MERKEALELLYRYIKEDNMRKHSLASEIVMIHLARKLGEDEKKWGLAGLLHDIDMEITNGDLSIHGIKGAQMLKELGLDNEIVNAIGMHNERSTGKERTTIFQHALSCCETITGMITATTLVYPDKKLRSVKSKSIIKRMKDIKFAASVSRDRIMECEKTGIELKEFAELALKAMCTISDDLGL